MRYYGESLHVLICKPATRSCNEGYAVHAAQEVRKSSSSHNRLWEESLITSLVQPPSFDPLQHAVQATSWSTSEPGGA